MNDEQKIGDLLSGGPQLFLCECFTSPGKDLLDETPDLCLDFADLPVRLDDFHATGFLTRDGEVARANARMEL